ncbi:hypothetical protein ACFLVA_00330 [Chloroflexota bacterium]
MLGQIEAKIGLFTVTARPKSWWRCAFLDFIPYIQGQKVRFRMVVTTLGDLPAETTLTYTVENTGDLLSWRHLIKLHPMQNGEKASFETEEIPLYRTGDSLFTVWGDGHVIERQAAFIFHTTSRNTVFLTVIGIIVTALVAFFTIT